MPLTTRAALAATLATLPTAGSTRRMEGHERSEGTLQLAEVEVSPGLALGDALFIATKLGFIGAIAGGAFAGFVSLVYRGRRLTRIDWVRFGIGGGILAGLVVPTFLLTGNLLSGAGFPALAHVLDDAVLAAVFGAIAAGGSLRLAQRAERLLPGERQDRLDLPGDVDHWGSAGETETAHRSHAVRY